ncbi:uncharacterized protein LOC110456031 [Mizuhopecten yessoensis]|uniref:Uncharacterized protein n=1 Tax=Mizuhopecten yessoensis TaxID=6573 RepID=A0A210QBU5_MIZYE|nr:uncharacterized protein LOC110456031 [Mizuhopecten yessoensis]OWF46204.1 hypothetical protein KP79_PYT08130 [Mizuhopecten yessoensis]
MASRNVIPRPETTNPPDDDSGDSSWGIVVPIVLVGLFIVSVIVFLYCHYMRKKQQQGPPDAANTSLGRFSRSLVGSSTTGIDYVRCSTRSTTPLRSSLRGDQAFVMPMAPQYHHGSQPKFTFYWEDDNWKLCPDSVNNMRGHLNPLSPIDEMDSSLMSDDVYMDVSKSYDVGAQAPFSPYHLTWVTPQAPPPSYEESEAGSPEKRLRLMSVNTTNSEDTYSTCHTFDKDAFHVHNNTLATDGEYSANSMSRHKRKSAVLSSAVLSEALTNTNLTNSQMTSYPSTPISSTGASLTTSSLDTGEDDDTSFVTSYHDTSYHISRQSVNNQSAAYTTARGSQGESEVSGVPSLPSSILYYHQKMAGNRNVELMECPPRLLSQPYNYSMASSMGSAESHYTDNTSLLPNVGSSNTSGNPSMSMSIPHSNVPGVVEQGCQGTMSPGDLSKLVNELSSIRPSSTEPTSINKGIVNSACVYDNNIGESYVTEQIHPQNASEGDVNFRHSITELFRSWSVTAELDYSSLSSRGASGASGASGATSMNTPQHENSFAWDNFPWHKNKGIPEHYQQQQEITPHLVEDYNHNLVEPSVNHNLVEPSANHNLVELGASGNVLDINRLSTPGRKVKFEAPVLVSKTYWV